MSVLRENDPSPCGPQCQSSTTLLWPQLLSKWQTVWQSQVVEIYHRDPLKRVAPGPSLQAGGRQTSDKQLFVLGHVLPSSPFIFSPLRVHFCCQAALLAANCPSSPLLFFFFPFRWSANRAKWLISLSFNKVLHCKLKNWKPFTYCHSS